MANDDADDGEAGRRRLLQWTAGGALLAVASGCSKAAQPAPAPAPPPSGEPAAATPALRAVDARVVRVVSVPTAVEGNVLPELVAAFEKQSGLRVDLRATDDVYGQARAGTVDLAVSHYGHKHAEQFVMEGFGEWPRTLFSNQMAFLGPKSDPAKIRGLEDAGEAFRRIAAARSPFVLNDIDGVRYLTEILWNAAGCPDRTGWFLDQREHRKEDAVRFASERGAYVLWGLTPFLRARDPGIALEPLVIADPLLQRMLVSIIVKGAKVSGVNTAGASALQAYLLSPAVQAHVRTVRYPGDTAVTWVPAGRHNRTAMLPKG